MSATTQNTLSIVPGNYLWLSTRDVGLVSNGIGKEVTLPIIEPQNPTVWKAVDANLPQAVEGDGPTFPGKRQWILQAIDGSGFLGIIHPPLDGAEASSEDGLPDYAGLVQDREQAWSFHLELIVYESDVIRNDNYRLVSDILYPGHRSILSVIPPAGWGTLGQVEIYTEGRNAKTSATPGINQAWQMHKVVT